MADHVRFMVTKSGTGGFGFPLPFIIPPTLHTHLSTGAGTVGPLKGPSPLEQCRVRSVEVCASTSVAATASRDVQL
jgi:hypothetical protein